jgi:cell wall-associated NlpC family hydrolase
MGPAFVTGTVRMSDLTLRSARYPGDDWPPAPRSVQAGDPAPTAPKIRRKRHITRRQRPLSRRPVAMSALICTMLCSLVARPAYGDPGQSIPDVGMRPVPNGQLVLPGANGSGPTTTYVATPVLGPFASKVMAEDVAVQALGEQVKQLQIDLQAAVETAESAEETWRAAVQRVEDLRDRADSAAAEAYKAAAGLGPLGEYADDLHKISVLAPGLGGQPGGQEAARDLLRAEQEARTADEAYKLATSVAGDLRGKFNQLNGEFTSRTAALVALKTQNATEYAKAVAQNDAYEQSLGGNLPMSINIDNMQADPRAIQAVNYALSKRGSPYVWGDEGPGTFDCSGLAYWAYRQVGVTVPRVANSMYYGTPKIVATRYSRGDLLLPGDLVYFATNMSDWRSIYHMGIYIGGGYMVQAPSTGDVVKVSPVSWSKLFGATRIFPAVPKPGATTQPPVTTTTTTRPPSSTSAPASPSSSTSTSPSASASTSTSPSASVTPSRSASASAQTSPSASPSTSRAAVTTSSSSSSAKVTSNSATASPSSS